jgi:hypothetical protein
MVWIKHINTEKIEKQGTKIKLSKKEIRETKKEKTNFKEMAIFLNSKGKNIKNNGEINSKGKGEWVDEKITPTTKTKNSVEKTYIM